MQMSVGEIKRNYDQAKNKKQQIAILADLNCCSREEIEKIVTVESKRSMPAVEKQIRMPVAENKVGDVEKELFKRLDEIEKEIKILEEEYHKVVIAIEVLGSIKKEGVAYAE